MTEHSLPAALAAALATKGYSTLTSVQEAVLVPEAAGRDLLVGGAGADTFVIVNSAAASDIDIIADFDVAADRLSLRQFGLTGLDDLTLSETADHLDLIIGTQTVRLEGLTASDLETATILF